MKNKLWVLMICAFLIGVYMPSQTFGSLQLDKIEANVLSIKFMFDRVEKQTDKPSFIYEGTTYVPLRFISESLGKEVTYDGLHNTIWIGSKPGDLSKSLLALQPKASTVLINKNSVLYDKKTYEKGIVFFNLRDSVKYYLNGEYLYFTAIIGPLLNYSNAEESYLVFYADDQEIYRTPKFVSRNSTSQSMPIKIKLDVTDVLNLKIVMEGGTTKLGIMEPKLWY